MIFIKKYLEYILLLLFSSIGIFTYKAYGFAWDEWEQRNIGEICYNYIFKNNLTYLNYQSRDHGAIFEIFLLTVEKSLNISNFRETYLMRHLVTHLFFLLSAFYFFKLIDLKYQNKKLATLGFLFLVLNPTIYGHSFFNSKDIPFLSLFIICFYQFAIAFEEKKIYQFVLLAIFTGLLINIRLMGILFVAFVIGFILMDLFISIKDKTNYQKPILRFILYTVTTIFITILTYPLLWHNPIQNFLYAFHNLSNYPWDATTLFKGAYINAQQISWDYIPTWFCINTPIIYLVLGLSGLILFLIKLAPILFRFDLKNIDKNNLLYLLTFVVPICVVIILHSALYDTWRHLFYIYPAFIMLAIYFINYCFTTKFKLAITGVAIFSITSVSIFIITNFPFHHVYFNQFVSLHKDEYLKKNYELDYWGVSYNKALEYILENDTSNEIKISADNATIIPNASMLLENQKKRILFVDSVYKSDYFVATYRWHPQDYYKEYKNIEEVTSFVVLNSKINTIFKVRK